MLQTPKYFVIVTNNVGKTIGIEKSCEARAIFFGPDSTFLVQCWPCISHQLNYGHFDHNCGARKKYTLHEKAKCFGRNCKRCNQFNSFTFVEWTHFVSSFNSMNRILIWQYLLFIYLKVEPIIIFFFQKRPNKIYIYIEEAE